jgi:hypothetical protein
MTNTNERLTLKILNNTQTPKNAITSYITRYVPSDVRIIELTDRQDTRRVSSELDKFIGTDLSSITLIAIKR